MNQLRQLMLEELQRRNFAATTIRNILTVLRTSFPFPLFALQGFARLVAYQFGEVSSIIRINVSLSIAFSPLPCTLREWL